MPFPIAALGAAAQIGGGIMANSSARSQAKRQMDFQEYMSSTAHQREVLDLKKAGLNPILSANKGASSPGGAMAPVRNIMEGMANTALQKRMNDKQLQLLDSQIANTIANTANTAAETKIKTDLGNASGLGADAVRTFDDIAQKGLTSMGANPNAKGIAGKTSTMVDRWQQLAAQYGGDAADYVRDIPNKVGKQLSNASNKVKEGKLAKRWDGEKWVKRPSKHYVWVPSEKRWIFSVDITKGQRQ